MDKVRAFYIFSAVVFVFSLFSAPASEKSTHIGFTIFIFFSVGIPLLYWPAIMIMTAEKHYDKAVKENRVRKDNERTPSTVEEDFKFLSVWLCLLLSFFLLLVTFNMWM